MHLAAGAHEVFLQTEYILTSIPPSMPSSERDKREMTLRSNQPKDAQQGIQRVLSHTQLLMPYCHEYMTI